MSTLERRVTELERRTSYAAADPFAERLNPEDRVVYLDFMRRWTASGREFEDFIRGMGKADLERLLQIHIDGLAAAGIGLEDLEGLDVG